MDVNKKTFGITEVYTPDSFDKSVISRYATQVALGSKLKEMLDGDAEPVVELTEKDVETTTEKDVETTTEPVMEPVEKAQEEIIVDEEQA